MVHGGAGEKRRRLLAGRILDSFVDLPSRARLWIDTWDHVSAFASLIAEEARERGWRVRLTVRTEADWLRSILHGSKDALDRVPDLLASALRETDAFLFTLGPRRPVPWSRIPARRRRSVSVWLDTRYDRSPYAREWSAMARTRKVRMIGIEASLATPERARTLGLPYRRWERVLWDGCAADSSRIARLANGLASALASEDEIHVTTPHGTDFRFSLARRPVIVDNGRATGEDAARGIVTFLPGGFVEVSADEDSAEGTVVYDVPIRPANGIVRNLCLSFENGRVVSSRMMGDRSAFAGHLNQGRDAGKFAFFGFGLNPGLEFGFTQDDKVLGGVTLGIGDNERKGGRNRARGADWWGCASHATVTIGRRTVMKEGSLRRLSPKKPTGRRAHA